MAIRDRKADHIRICMNERVAPGYCYWDDIRFVHNALPEIDYDYIDMSCTLFGRKLSAPIMVTAITGGFSGAKKINSNIAEACAELGLGMGIGSERAGVSGVAAESYSIVKDFDVPLMIGNIGAVQLIPQKSGKIFTDEMIDKAVELIDADVLAIHLNPLQEAVQPEGDMNFDGCYEAIRNIARRAPVMVKETGAGISEQVADRLKGIGVQGLDISGMGGTSFSAVEFYRAIAEENRIRSSIGDTFFDWGIPAPVSLAQCKNCGLPLIASGGILDGIHVAASISMGATAAGVANVILKEASESADAVKEKLTIIMEELKTAMLLTGSKDLKQLSKARYVVLGETKEWMEQL
ncbi:MAG: type 2 isopentenyl-diphosphate Delta-isomerase [Thermoplasmata archaeon]|jgi:isopentenyl-diphosphate delta-isomerase|nr:type 2 isopentenyl-diphosphate Delta-isomerase [Thermoplasmata archaeon]